MRSADPVVRRGVAGGRLVRVLALVVVAVMELALANDGAALPVRAPSMALSTRGAALPWAVTTPGRLSALARDVARVEQRLVGYRRDVQGLHGVDGASLLRVDQAYDQDGAAAAGLSSAIRKIRSRLDTSGEQARSLSRGLDALAIRLEQQRRTAEGLLTSMAAERFRGHGVSHNDRQQFDLARHVLVRITLLGHDVARLRVEVSEASRGLSRQARGPIGQLAQAISASAGLFGGVGGVFLICPVDQPRSYSDDFGYARAGHPHQGNDILAPLGTPVRAPFPGVAADATNGTGGLSVKLFGRLGWVYNAHLTGFGTLGRVEAGTIIGYVGNTGNAAGGPTHDHFEWHPGGGGAVDPYPLLNEVC